MAHAYTPGLKVLESTSVKKERRLPLKGEVLVDKGADVVPEKIVARTHLPGNVQMVNVANLLNVDAQDVPDFMLIDLGKNILKGDLLAETKGLFGLFKSEVKSPVDGILESVSKVTGQVVIREAPIPVEIDAYMNGNVSEVMDKEGDARVDISAIKVFVPAAGTRVVDRAIQIHGWRGVSSDTPLAGMYQGFRTLRLADGPDEVHRILIAKEILKKYHDGLSWDFGV